MRAWLLVLMLAAPAHALVIEDPEGDLETRWFDQDVSPYENPQEDLLLLEVVEDAEGFGFRIEVAGEPPEVDVLGSTFTYVELWHGEQRYRFVWGDARVAPTVYFQNPEVILYRTSEDTGGEVVGRFDLERMGTTFSWWAPRALFIDESGAPPRIGGVLTGIQAASGSNSHLLAGPVSVPHRYSRDLVPDDGGGELEIRYGLSQKEASLDSAEPFRVSNGESGRFYYNVSLSAEEDGLFTFATKGVPAGWQVRLPFTELDVRRGEVRDFLVEVTVPFVHQHGGRASFILEATAGDAVGRLEMGMHYVDTPQPSGHHPRLWLHAWNPLGDTPLNLVQSRDEPGWPYVNALEDDPGDLGATIEPNRNGILDFGNAGQAYEVSWIINLRPGLRMGLNVTDQTRPAEITFDLPRALTNAQVAGSFYVQRDGKNTPVAAFESDRQDLAAGTSTVEADIIGEPGIIPYQTGQHLLLEVALRTDEPMVHVAHTAPYLVPGSTWFELPLAEYSDSIADASGFVQPTPSEAEVEAFEEPEEAPKKESPGLPLVAFGLVVLLADRLRRHGFTNKLNK